MFNVTRDHRNVLVLATCQMLFGTGRSLLLATAPLIAYSMASRKALATLPHALVIIGTAMATIPASLLMRRTGRRIGFILGSLIGALGGAIAALAIVIGHFWLFCLGTSLFGVFAGFGQLYRFAVADVAAADFKSRAISLVLAGGVVAAFLGPELAKWGKDLVGSSEFLGAYLGQILVILLSAVVVSFVDIPKLTPAEEAAASRPMLLIMRQPIFIVAALAAMIGQGVMNLLMTATPIVMKLAQHHFSDTALVIEWHIAGMFGPGFFTGSLIKRYGEIPIILAGLLLLAAAVVVALSGNTVFLFWLAMALLGVGWNFAFTAGTSLMTEAHTLSERAKTQSVVNFLIYGTAAVSALSSGTLLHFFGWRWVNLTALPLIAAAVAATLWVAWLQRCAARTA